MYEKKIKPFELALSDLINIGCPDLSVSTFPSEVNFSYLIHDELIRLASFKMLTNGQYGSKYKNYFLANRPWGTKNLFAEELKNLFSTARYFGLCPYHHYGELFEAAVEGGALLRIRKEIDGIINKNEEGKWRKEFPLEYYI